jgi:hypothetical protein
MLRHPDVFAKAAAWDAPLMLDKPGKYGSGDIFGTEANFEGYRVSKLLEDKAGNFQKDKRLMRDGPARKHDWHRGWVKEAVERLVAE